MSGVDLSWADVEPLVRGALAEDVGARDLTSDSIVPPAKRARGVFVAKQVVVVAGLDVARAAFRLLDAEVSWEPYVEDGATTAVGQQLAEVRARARALLAAERVALNFLQRMSAVASLTRRFVEAVAGTGVQVRDTRKTTPLLRALEKYAVERGGGVPHRSGLDSGVLVKENHIRLAGSVTAATRRAVAAGSGHVIEVEVERIDQIEEALGAGAGMILLDNFEPAGVHEAVRLVARRVPVEVSGGVRLDNVRAYAEAGPDFIAVGALTHSAPAADISLEIEPSE